MEKKENIREYIQALLQSTRMKHQVAYHQMLSGNPGEVGSASKCISGPMKTVLHQAGIENLYCHQAEAIDYIQKGLHTVIATPTASGKTLIYNLPVFEQSIQHADSRALYLFPLKALAQDQWKNFQETAAHLTGYRPSAAIYDGDTSAWNRKKIRLSPPNVLFTNPEMLHLAILPYHDRWVEFLSGLRFVIIDEVHTYRGVMGSHMAQVFRRLIRICHHYGAGPTFIFSSATIANPGELAGQLTGLEVKVVSKSGSPQGIRHVVLMNPDTGPAQSAILLLKAALHRGLRTIVYTQSRKMTELIAIWAGSRSGVFKDKISAYRAGFLPEERRDIEARLSGGDLLAVISTSALELGIDIGDLDLCILVGYPGSVMATWQRGGRVGRSGQEAALILVAGEDALDQYFVRNPVEFMKKKPEAAVINPYNMEILKKHLACAAAEIPLHMDEPFVQDQSVGNAISLLEKNGDLLRSGDGERLFSRLKNPHRYVDLRGTGNRFTIICSVTSENLGEIDGFRAFTETHPGAIYLHKGKTYKVDHLLLNELTVKASPAEVPYYTRARSHKHTEIVELLRKKNLWGTTISYGRLKVTQQVTGYEKWRIHARKKINVIPLDLPPQTFETNGFWITIPDKVQEDAISRYLHFMGGIHAMEHALIGVVPFFVMADRNDLGGISIPLHPQLNQAAVFVYDGGSGGAGLCDLAYHQAEELFARTLEIIATCPCESGCPACVHSPKCGSGNRPIDKASAYFIMNLIKRSPGGYPENSIRIREKKIEAGKPEEKTRSLPSGPDTVPYFGVLDLETQRSAQEVGGWHLAGKMGISCAVLYDSRKDEYLEFLEDDIPSLIEHLTGFHFVVGFNIKRFDFLVMSSYTNFDFSRLKTLDILEEVHQKLGYRLSLDHLAGATLGVAKGGNGLMALEWWKRGEIRKIIDYCKMDVEITRDLFLFGKEKGYLIFKNKAGHPVRVPVDWRC
ncbi:MAG: DEAD/DEAH box helicase [Pseudomonadota bacterium]